MSKYSKEDILRMVDEEDVGFIRLQFTDVFGTVKNIAVTAGQLEQALNNECSFDGSGIDGFVRIEEDDMYLYPDLDSFEIFPWRPQTGKVARLICDIHKCDGTPFEGDSRYILKRVIREAAKMGIYPYIAPECEFCLFPYDTDGEVMLQTQGHGSYFDVAPLDTGENVRRDIILALEDMGIDVRSSYHEHSPYQHEIDLQPVNALAAADNIVTFRMTCKTIASRHGLYATFMPKPKFGISGSGMHINMSLATEEGKNIFADENGKIGLSDDAYHFIAGIMKHARGMSAITNPLVNSYKRLVPGYEAPVYIAWSAKNRSPLIRIPASRGNGTRVELRNPDPTANPYLVLALCLAAGLDGIKNKIEVPESVDCNIYEMTPGERRAAGIENMPADLKEAVDCLVADEFLCSVLGEHITTKYVEAKMKEWENYTTRVSQWEIDEYLYKY